MADYNSKYSGEQVEALLDQVASGNAGGGGGGGITVETDPVFTASPAATITEDDKATWSGKQDAIDDLATIRSGAEKGATALQSIPEGYVTTEDLATVASSGSYADLVDKPTIPSEVTESTVSGWGFTKNAGTYSKPSGGIPKSDLSVDVQSALNAANAYQGTVTNVKINGTTKSPENGIVDLGNVGTYDKPSTGIPKSDLESEVQTSLRKADNSLQVDTFGYMELVTLNGFAGRGAGLVYALPNEATGDEDDVLLSRNTVKTINGQSIVGSGNIEIEGGTSSGEVATKEIINVSGVIEELEPNKVYILDVDVSTMSAEIQSIVWPEVDNYAEYTVIIVAVDGSGDNRPISLTLPSDVMWPNGVVPDLSQPGYYELSIAYWASTNDGGYNAVLTRFNFAE